MHSQDKSGKLKVKNGWLYCPACGMKKVLRLEPNTRATNLPVFCRHCGKETIVNIETRLSL